MISLAPYAFKSTLSRGREFPEEKDEFRTCFERDRDRIVHSKAFRRLSGKTQVFVSTYGDHYRDRLSHTLEVAQISRGLARILRLNEDLAEAIALAHDLGHTPFGHAGEETLGKIMREFGLRYEHNEQSRRIVEKLENKYPGFPGLNLSWEVREGLIKHQTQYDQAGRKISGKTLESQVVDLADEIAYHNHDLDDGLRDRLFKLEDLRKLRIWKRAEAIVFEKYGSNILEKYLRHRAISALIGIMMRDVYKESMVRIKKWKIREPEDAGKKQHNAIAFSSILRKEIAGLQKFLWSRMYRSKKVISHSRRGQKIIKFLFWKFYKNPELLPIKFRRRIDADTPKEIMIKDYIAGMTDNYALSFYKKL